MYVNVKMIPVDTVPGMGGRSMMYWIHCKKLCKCHSVPPPSTTIKGKK
jgi:hypothetical protein